MSSFYAKPSGGYLISSTEGTANITAAYHYLSNEGYSDNAIVGILGNVVAESGLNPWRWQNDTVNYYNGYGLFQYTPASDYIDASWIPNWAPNEDTSAEEPSADPDDALGQLYAFVNDTFGKWVGYCWRNYWDPNDYPDLYAKHNYILSTYGSGSYLTLNQFKDISDYSDSCFAFLACFEGPAVPNYLPRLSYCYDVKQIIDNISDDNLLLFKRIQDIQFNRKFNVN